MEPLLWSAGLVMVGVVGVCVYTVLRLKTAERWLLEAREEAPAKKLAKLDAFLTTIRSEFTTVLEQIDEKHDRWMREQASLRTYIYRRLGKEQKPEDGGSETGVPDRITSEEAQLIASPNGANDTDDRQTVRRKIKQAYYAARGQQQ